MTLPVGAKGRNWIFLLAATVAIACGLSVARTAYRAYEHRDSLSSLTVGYLEVSNNAVSSIEVSYPGRAWSGESLRALADSAVAVRVVLSRPPGA